MDLDQKNQSHFNLSNVFVPEFPVQCERGFHQWRFEKDLQGEKGNTGRYSLTASKYKNYKIWTINVLSEKHKIAVSNAGNYETRTQTRALIWSQENNLQIKLTHQLFYRHAKEVQISILYV